MKASHSHWTTFEGLPGQQKSRYVKNEQTAISKIGVAYLRVFQNNNKTALVFCCGVGW